MSWTGAAVFLMTLLAEGAAHYAFACALLSQRPSWRGYGAYAALLAACDGALLFLAPEVWGLPLALGQAMGAAGLAFGRRGWRCLTGGLGLFGLRLAVSLLAWGLSLLLLGPGRAEAWRQGWGWTRLLVTLSGLPVLCLLPPLRLLVRAAQGRRLSDGMYGLRALMLVAAAALSVTLLFDRLQSLALTQRLDRVGLLFGVSAALLGVCLTYLGQDLRYLQLRRRRATLEEQRKRNEDMVAQLRAFRGEMIERVEALGDAALADPDQRRARYERIAQGCAGDSPENVLALGRVAEPALAALLLQKLERCRQLGLPMLVQAEAEAVFRRVPPWALCQAAGVLLDNAIEAAQGCAAPRLGVEVARAGRGAALTVLNTYAPGFDPADFLGAAPASTKAGHAGAGLQSVAALCRRYPALRLDKRVQGRFVLVTLTVG